jgi:hypothetical protein
MEVTTNVALNLLLARTSVLFVQVRNSTNLTRSSPVFNLGEWSWKILIGIEIKKVVVWKSHTVTTNEFVRMNTSGLHVTEVYALKWLHLLHWLSRIMNVRRSCFIFSTVR